MKRPNRSDSPCHLVTSSPPRLRVDAWIIFLTSFLAYAYFFQGTGWNQMAHFSTMRALVEDHTADISRFTNLTQDISIGAHGVYSNKPPGIALLGVPFYFVLAAIERSFGMDLDVKRVWLGNLQVMTILLSALPAAILNVQIYFALRREKMSARKAMLMTGAFAFGSLSLPYGGLLMSHLGTASMIFGAWYLLTARRLDWGWSLASGSLMGLAILCDLLSVPAAGILGLYLLMRLSRTRESEAPDALVSPDLPTHMARREPRRPILVFAYSVGTFAGIAILLIYDRLAHGAASFSGPLHPTTTFTEPGRFLGEFLPPQWNRIYWISYQPMRGLFVTCPIFLACLLSLLTIRRPFRISMDRVVVLLILLPSVLFYLTFVGWSGGWSIGPRYMIPALPLLWMLARPAFERFGKTCAVLSLLSIVQMLAVTSVNAQAPDPNNAPPRNSDPVRASLIVFLQGRTNQTLDGYNLGGVLHLPERCQLLPIYAILAIYYARALTQPRSTPPANF